MRVLGHTAQLKHCHVCGDVIAAQFESLPTPRVACAAASCPRKTPRIRGALCMPGLTEECLRCCHEAKSSAKKVRHCASPAKPHYDEASYSIEEWHSCGAWDCPVKIQQAFHHHTSVQFFWSGQTVPRAQDKTRTPVRSSISISFLISVVASLGFSRQRRMLVVVHQLFHCPIFWCRGAVLIS